jgi:hypothetical protein
MPEPKHPTGRLIGTWLGMLSSAILLVGCFRVDAMLPLSDHDTVDGTVPTRWSTP